MAIASGVIVGWPSSASSIPTNWTRETDFDARHIKGTAAGVAPNVTGGSTTHTHSTSSHTHSNPSHSHTGTTNSHSNQMSALHAGPQSDAAVNGHTHPWTSDSTGSGTSGATTPGTASGSNDPAYFKVIFISSDGVDTGFPDGCVMFYNASSAPAGWTHHSGSKNRYLIGADGSGGDGGGTGGGGHTHSVDSHTHGTAGHTHATVTTSSTTNIVQSRPGSNLGVPVAHSHTLSISGPSSSGSAGGGTTGSYTNLPEYHRLMCIENTSGSSSELDLGIAMWADSLGSIPSEYYLCDGSNSTPDMRGRYCYAVNSGSEVSDESGATGHDHGNPSGHSHGGHTHTMGTPSTTGGTSFMVGGANTPKIAMSHNHEFGSTSSSGGSTGSTASSITAIGDSQPAFRTVAFIQLQAGASAISSPAIHRAMAAAGFI